MGVKQKNIPLLILYNNLLSIKFRINAKNKINKVSYMLEKIMADYKKNNNTLIKYTSILNNEVEYTDKFDVTHIIGNNLKDMSKSEIVKLFVDIVADSFVDMVKVCSKITKYDINDKINFYRANFFRLMDDEKFTMDEKIPLFIDYFKMIDRLIETYNSNKIVTNISLTAMSLDLINYTIESLEPYQYDHLGQFLDLKDEFASLLNALFLENLDNHDKLIKNTCIQIVLDYIVKNKDFDEENVFVQMLFNVTLFSNTKNQQYIKDIIVSLGYENHLNAFNAAVMFANKQEDEFNKYVEDTDFGEDIILISNILIYNKNYDLLEKKMNESLKDLDNLQNVFYDIYNICRELYTDIKPDSKRFFLIIKEFMPYIHDDDKYFASEIAYDALIYAKKANVFKEEKSKIYEYMKKQLPLQDYCHILLDEKEFDLLLDRLSELTDKEDILRFAFFVKYSKESLPNYEKFINRINKIDDEDVKSVLQEDII